MGCSGSSIKFAKVSSPKRKFKDHQPDPKKEAIDVVKSQSVKEGIDVESPPKTQVQKNQKSEVKERISRFVIKPEYQNRSAEESYVVPNPNKGIICVVPHLCSIEDSSLINRRRMSASPRRVDNDLKIKMSRVTDRHLSHVPITYNKERRNAEIIKS